MASYLAEESERRSLTAYGTLYRALGRLAAMGMLESRWEDPQIAADENRPGRRLYVITGQGLAAARATAKTPAFFRFARPRRRRVAPA
jgi:PadR family transcriptional regulator